MYKPPLPRVEIFRQARMILVRQLIDIGRLSINVVVHQIHIKGRLDRLPGVVAPLTPECVQDMFASMKRIPGINQVHGELDNWQMVDEMGQVWVVKDTATSAMPGTAYGVGDTYVMKIRSNSLESG